MREYEVNISGIPHTVQLDDAAAKAYGDRAKPFDRSKAAATAADEKAAAAPKNKAAAASSTKAS